MPPKNLHSRTGRDEKKGKTQEKTERGSRKRSSSAGSEKMERELVAGRKLQSANGRRRTVNRQLRYVRCVKYTVQQFSISYFCV